MSIFKSFNKSFNSALGNVVKKTRKAQQAVTKGFSNEEFSRFMQQSSNVASQDRFVADSEVEPTFKSVKKTDAAKQNGQFVNQDQMKDMMKAFRQRQQEVFGRRAAPGVAQQTRFM